MSNRTVLVAGAGGFIGGHLVADLLARGFSDVRAVDVKPFDEWFQVFDGADNICADLQE
jgi:nucleoside-diphosphate-sugar epimerase